MSSMDEEIDKLVDKFSNDLKVKLKKMVERQEKMLVKQLLASQKNTTQKSVKSGKESSSGKDSVRDRQVLSSRRNRRDKDDSSDSDDN
uniref:Uncharacterized protein n=1 Tax=viral metagenome TaxID=1070528 RepID=A0A6C0CYX9_9ZZZZ